MIIAFVAIALPSDDGRVALATVLWMVAAWGDYLDGMLARVTGQYSRLGALMDPFIDRALVLAGAAVAWKFELLPRWALAVLGAREIAMLALVAVGLRMGLDIKVNWVGRWAVWPTMTAIALAMVFDSWILDALIYFGIASSLAASAIYARDAVRDRKRMRVGPGGG